MALQQPLTLAETRGFIGERYDETSGIFGNPKHEMQALVERYGSVEKAFRALDDAAQAAFARGEIEFSTKGIAKQRRISVGGIDVDLVGGKAVDGRFELGSASRRLVN